MSIERRMVSIKSQEVQLAVSNVVFNLCFFHTLMSYLRDPSALSTSYPQPSPSYVGHVQFFIVVIAKVCFWSIFTMYVTFLVLLLIKSLLVDLVTDSIVKSKSPEDHISTRELHDLVTSYLWKGAGTAICLHMFMGYLIVAFVFATFVINPDSMKTQRNRDISIRMFFGALMITQAYLTTIHNINPTTMPP